MLDSIEIIGVSYHRPRDFSVCIDSVLQHTDLPFNLTIIDNSVGAIDDTIRKLPEHVRIIRNQENIGKGRSFKKWYHTIMNGKKPKYLVSLDCDIKVPPEWLSNLIRASYKTDMKLGAIAPVSLRSENDSFEEQLRSKNICMHGGPKGFRTKKEIAPGLFYSIDTAGSVFLIDREFYESIGGYPGTSLFGHDDGFICGKANKRQRFIGFTSDVSCVHLKQDDTDGYRNWKRSSVNKVEVRSGHWDRSHDPSSISE